MGLDWSPWVPFDAPREYFYIPKAPGVYRIRATGNEALLTIGETGQSLHKKISELRQSLRRADLMPWSDPHDVAPCLWAYWVEWVTQRNAEGQPEPGDDDETPGPVMLECSAAPLDAAAPGRKGMEAYLLYQYRQEAGESPLCSFGRFHPRYRKSSRRCENRRGGKLEDHQQDNPAGFPGIGPLEATGHPGDPGWMGLEWPEWQSLTADAARNVPPGAGLYLLADAATREIVYIGHAAAVAARLMEHQKKAWDDRELVFSYQITGPVAIPHTLRELETDLIGSFYEQNKKAPEYQYRSSR
ncbi:MAG: hypothetical protein GYA23_13875 [Methanomicrobiales archaeon]|nr:hypothetical protein [Methanomicrobiales archaeon]